MTRLTPSSAVNFRRSISPIAPAAPSPNTKTFWTEVMAAIVRISSPHLKCCELSSYALRAAGLANRIDTARIDRAD